MNTKARSGLFLLAAWAGLLIASPAATIDEPDGGFSYDAPDQWQRIPNKHKKVKPRIMFDLLSSKDPRRMVIPAGYESAELPAAISATEGIIRAQLKVSLNDGQSSRISTESGVTVTRILYSTGDAQTPRVVLFAFGLPKGGSACFVGLVASADPDAALADYDAIFATLRFKGSE